MHPSHARLSLPVNLLPGAVQEEKPLLAFLTSHLPGSRGSTHGLCEVHKAGALPVRGNGPLSSPCCVLSSLLFDR